MPYYRITCICFKYILTSNFFYQILLEFVTKCLEEGNKHKSTKTMAFPTLGTGSLNYPPDKVAEVFTKCIQNFNQKYPKTELTLISIVVNNHRKKREIFEQVSQLCVVYGYKLSMLYVNYTLNIIIITKVL